MANVAYFLRVVRQTQPSGWTMEEVANPTLLEYFDEQRRAEPDLIDYDVFDMYQYGVCQTRKRFIAGSPRLIRRLRDYRDPSSHKRVADVCPDRPARVVYVGGTRVRRRLRRQRVARRRRRRHRARRGGVATEDSRGAQGCRAGGGRRDGVRR